MMSRIVTVALVGFVFFSCQGTSETGEQKEFLTDSPVDSDSLSTIYLAFSDNDTRKLENYFEPTLLSKLDQYVLSYNNASTDVDFEKSYNEGIALFGELDEALNTPKTQYLIAKIDSLTEAEEYEYPVDLLSEYETLNGLLGPIFISCAAECTALDFLFDLEAMMEKAKLTAGKTDDNFIELVMFMEDGTYGYASYPGFKVWTVPTWDYGGYSLVGSGTITEAVNRMLAYEKKNKLFAPQLAAMHEDIVSELQGETIFAGTLENVLAEYEDLLKMDFFSKEEKERIRKHYEEIKSAGAEGFQFNCETGDCSYG